MPFIERKNIDRINSISSPLFLGMGLVTGLVLVLFTTLFLGLGAELFSKLFLGLIVTFVMLLFWQMGVGRHLWVGAGLVLGQILGLVLVTVLGLGAQKVAGLIVGIIAGLIAGLELCLGLSLAAGLSSIVLKLLNISFPFWLRRYPDIAIELEEAILRARGTQEGLSLNCEIFYLRFDMVITVLSIEGQKVLKKLGFSI